LLNFIYLKDKGYYY